MCCTQPQTIYSALLLYTPTVLHQLAAFAIQELRLAFIRLLYDLTLAEDFSPWLLPPTLRLS